MVATILTVAAFAALAGYAAAIAWIVTGAPIGRPTRDAGAASNRHHLLGWSKSLHGGEGHTR